MYPSRLSTIGLSAEEMRNISITPLSDKIHTSVTTSLRNLSVADGPQFTQNRYIDCLLLHLSDQADQEMLDAWGILETFVPERIRHLGITNMSLPMLELLYNSSMIKPAVVQNRFPMARKDEIALRNFCADRGIMYQTYPRITKKGTFLQCKPVMALAQAAAVPQTRALTSLVLSLPNVAVLNSAWKRIRMREEVEFLAKVEQWADEHNSEWERLKQEFKQHADMKITRQVAEGESRGLDERLKKVQGNSEGKVQTDGSKAEL